MNIDTAKSNLSDLGASTLDHITDTLQRGQEALSETAKTVSADVAQTASKIMHTDPASTLSSKLATLGKVVAAAGSARAIASAFNTDMSMRWILGAMNLQRRPSALARVATGVGLVTAGAAVGAGVALLFTPKTGAQNREALRRGLRLLQSDAESVVEQVETKAREVAEQVETKTREVAEQVETKTREVAGQVETKAREIEGSVSGFNAVASDDATKGTGAVVTGSRPRIPGLSHRSPKI